MFILEKKTLCKKKIPRDNRKTRLGGFRFPWPVLSVAVFLHFLSLSQIATIFRRHAVRKYFHNGSQETENTSITVVNKLYYVIISTIK